MTMFLWVAAFCFGATATAQIATLASRKIPRRTPGTPAIDAVVNVAFLVWAAVLLREVA
ncbi:hypothetical protein QMA69_05335 [Burkholderia pseudomallei]|uniref:hypothetical protein n=1 Tax=Burkholderia pseudomallei TaxID=28450 RepID=UPI002DBE1985|nr:hypothetical protein [Burkholderia pseudomallei]MEB5483947.1 hypothetical protein [Burkholderia pseudomallei]MEB5490798.1 hypothetical protein [Burkholderia pseudomallei]MEB5497498.1 hypothetical protein [Burkholderia pseudomallei]MEB5502771.1 hypothetical protein [Burkholderia pseudomallei]MEB5510151.1 hypothetical protein [Burkholderia pseudomallei]